MHQMEMRKAGTVPEASLRDDSRNRSHSHEFQVQEAGAIEKPSRGNPANSPSRKHSEGMKGTHARHEDAAEADGG